MRIIRCKIHISLPSRLSVCYSRACVLYSNSEAVLYLLPDNNDF